MESLKEFLDQLKERLTSPFFFSFLIAWLVLNWQITIALFWWNDDQWGNLNIFQFIEANATLFRSLIYPLIFALGYTFGYPFFAMISNAVATFANTKAQNWQLSISKSSKVSIDKLLEERKQLQEKRTELESVVAEEKKYKSERDKAVVDKESLEISLSAKTKEFENQKLITLQHVEKIKEVESQIEQINNLIILLGLYTLKNSKAEVIIEIDSTAIVLLGRTNPEKYVRYNDKLEIFTIRSFYFHPTRKTAVLVVMANPKALSKYPEIPEIFDPYPVQILELKSITSGWEGTMNAQPITLTERR